MTIAVWNIRGIGSRTKKDMIKSLITQERIDIMGLVESKHNDISAQDMYSCWGNQDIDWLNVPAEEGGSGGMILAWTKESFTLVEHKSMQHWISAKGILMQDNFGCHICLVYAPNDRHKRLEVWNQLRELQQTSSEPWILMGDFNEVVQPQERRGATLSTPSMRELAQFIQDDQMIDMEINIKFTWMRNNAASRLDRMLISAEFMDKFPGSHAYCKERVLSDHYPIILAFYSAKWGPTPFRSLDCWLKEPSFVQVFKNEWQQLVGLPLEQKLKRMKAPLKKWNREVFGHIDSKIQSFQKELAQIDLLAQNRELQECDWQRRAALQSQLWLWKTRKERYWKQLSRCKLLKEGDKNTRFFHKLATIRRRQNMIVSIKKDDVILTEPTQVRKVIIQHFKQLYTSHEKVLFDIAALGLNKLTVEERNQLENPVTMEEVKEAIMSCDPSKAPGFDGFNIKCLKHVWPIIGEEFSKYIIQFFESGHMNPCINITWVTLIPKKKIAEEVKDYRPISMVGSVYKVIAKILSRRLRDVLPNLVGETQTAFVGGRQILDGVLIANEVVNWLKKKKKAGTLFKLDFEKAYDTISWESIDMVLKEMGFGEKWRTWINSCVSTARISILFNGCPCKPFKMGRGLRQGDPLSPFLFVLVAEVLNRALNRAANLGLFKGLQVGANREMITHLQFADDTLLFCEAEELYLQNLKNVLLSFLTFSGLAVNYGKSGLIVFGKNDQWARRISGELKCKLVQLPCTYLGIPLGANMRKVSSWQPVIEKIQGRLNTWKGTCLSRAGRLVLIKAVLNSLPIYYLSLFKLPNKVAQEINKIQRRFLWSGQNQGRCNALVNWEVIQKPKTKGGLGVMDCTMKNAALLFKWWWRYASEEGSLWRRIVDSIHEDDSTLLPNKNTRKITGTWNDIKKLATNENQVSKAFFQHVKLQVGDGGRVRFWQDKWIGETILQDVFTNLYALSSQQKEVINNMGWFEGNVWRWVLAWKRVLSTEECREEAQLHRLLQQHTPHRLERDKLLWDQNSKFSAKTLYVKAVNTVENDGAVDRLVCTVWQKIVPPKVQLMVWIALLGKLNTKDKLWRKGIISEELNQCTFCHNHAEDINHLLATCTVAWSVWQTIAGDLGEQITNENSLRNLYATWLSKNMPNKTRRKIWLSSFFATLWSLWMHRNGIIFKQRELDVQGLCHMIKWRVTSWSKVWMEEVPYSAELLAHNFQALPLLF